VFDPTKLDGIISGLRTDADSLRGVASRLSSEVSSTVWTCPRADRFRQDFERHRQDLVRRAGELDRIARQVVALKADVQRELRYIAAIEQAVFDFFENVAKAALAAAQAVEQGAKKLVGDVLKVGKGVLTGDSGEVRDGINDIGSLFGHWSWQPTSLPPAGDPRWRDVDRYMRQKSHTADAHHVPYGPPPPPGRLA